jgi:predicted transcriptional regulator
LTHGVLAMYTYIVERTQIYLSPAQASALDREAKRTGVTRSHLIREAIEERYGLGADRERLRSALRDTAGLWKDRAESGEAYVERIRKDRRMKELFPDRLAEGPPDD